MNFFAAASLSRPSRGFIPLVSFFHRVASAATSLRLVTVLLPSTVSMIFLLSASRGVSSALSFLFEARPSLLRPFLFLVFFPSLPSTQVSRISTCGVVRDHQDYRGDCPGGHGSSLSSDSDIRQLEHDRSITLFVSLEPSFHHPFRFASTPETFEVGDPHSNTKILFQY